MGVLAPPMGKDGSHTPTSNSSPQGGGEQRTPLSTTSAPLVEAERRLDLPVDAVEVLEALQAPALVDRQGEVGQVDG